MTSYGSLYLSVSGIYGTAPIITAWVANNSDPHYRRATSIAIGIIATTSVSPPTRIIFGFPIEDNHT